MKWPEMSRQIEAAWELHRFLAEAGIPYVIIGGMAVLVWGRPRLTVDVDLTISVPLDEADDVLRFLTDRFEPRVDDPLEFARRSRVVLLWASNGCPVDISLALPGYEDEMMRRAVDFEFEPGKSVKVCSPEDLIVHKVVAGRPGDIKDVEGIVQRQGDKLDIGLIGRWLAFFAELLADGDITRRFERIWENYGAG